MKKIVLLIGLVLVSISGFSQVEKMTAITIKDSVALVADTTTVKTAGFMYDYRWAITAETFSLDAADATVTIQVSSDTTSNNWVNYSSNSSITLAASGMHAYQGDDLVFKYVRVITAPVSVTSGEYRLKFEAVRLR